MLDALAGLCDPASPTRPAARIVLARSISSTTAAWVRRLAHARGVAVSSESIETATLGANLAIASSGTATLECAVLGIPPVIVYRTDPLTYAVAKRWVRVPSIGLPNVLLGERAFPELVQSAVTPAGIRNAALELLMNPAPYRSLCEKTRTILGESLDEGTAGARVARMLEPWLS
jgi:lipid-A-disaccharide synthase